MKMLKHVFLMMALSLSLVSLNAHAADLDDVTIQVLESGDHDMNDVENSIDLPDATDDDAQGDHSGQGKEDAQDDDSGSNSMDNDHEDDHDEMDDEHEDEHEDDDSSQPQT